MLIMNDRPALIALPYTKGRNAKFFEFRPGKNEIPNEIWKTIKKYHAKKWFHWSKFLKPFETNERDIAQEIEIESNPEQKKEFNQLSSTECLSLIRNTNNCQMLDEYLQLERQDRHRKYIIEAITQKIKQLHPNHFKPTEI